MKYSIIIPTCKSENLYKCLESIYSHTALTDKEIIIVANGFDGERKDEYLWFPEKIGYTRAVNEGIKKAKGEFIILLNDDIILLPQVKDDWVNKLVEPFKDPQIAVTGPMLNRYPGTDADFILFFCAAIPRRIFDEIGLLDPIFNPGYSEDIDFCLRAEKAGYKVKQVPEFSDRYYAPNKMVGNFPIFHKGNDTFKDTPDDNLIHRNDKIIKERYIGDTSEIDNALKIDSYMQIHELLWLAEQAKRNNIIIEVGSWVGRSTRALGDNTKGVVYAVDHWAGSIAEPGMMNTAAQMDGDNAYYSFLKNNWDLVRAGKIIPIRMSSKSASAYFKELGIKADMIFIDAGHTYEEVKEDIKLWAPLLKENGLLCGHDYSNTREYIQVAQAVDEVIGKIENPLWTSIWATRDFKIKPSIFDCFIFNREFDILEKRFETLYDVVDRFVIVEATRTHGNKEKPLYFQENLKRFEKYLNKVSHIIVDDYPLTDSWGIERHQRDCIMRGLINCKDEDYIIISDCDEIPSPRAIKSYRGNGVDSFEMDLFQFNNKVRAKDKWREAKILPYGILKTLTPCGARYAPKDNIIKNGGSHYSYFGGVDTIIKKIEDTAHQELNIPKFKDRKHIENAMIEGLDLFDREEIKFEKV